MRLAILSLAFAFGLSGMLVLPESLPTSFGSVSFVAEAYAKAKTVKVKSYKKKNGTRVKAHKRSK